MGYLWIGAHWVSVDSPDELRILEHDRVDVAQVRYERAKPRDRIRVEVGDPRGDDCDLIAQDLPYHAPRFGTHDRHFVGVVPWCHGDIGLIAELERAVCAKRRIPNRLDR